MGKILITTGYMGSGSSALTDILSEIDSCKNETGSLEYVFLHCPDGLFDLEDKLLLGNNALRSDEAIHRFISCMQDLYNKKHYWVGNYKTKLTHKFMDCVYEFINELGTHKIEEDWAHWYFTENPNTSMLIKKGLKRVADKIPFINLPYPKMYKEVYLAYPSQTKFYMAAHKFLYSIFTDLHLDKSNLIFDQLVLPHNLYRMDKYFDDDTVVFLVDRDPRDVFIGNKYFWLKNNQHVVFPMEVEKFCDVYMEMRKNEREYSTKKVVRIHFEDLIYRYEDTLKNIYKTLGVSAENHKRKGEFFKPNISINNTQLFKINDRYEKCGHYIMDCLGDYVYDFPEISPYEIYHNEVF